MENDSGRELLCLNGDDKKYAIDFQYVAEICRDIQMSKIPCLPEHFIGLCNYKGMIVPILSKKEEDEEQEFLPLVIILKTGKYYMGLCVTDGLSIITPEEGQRIKSQAAKESEDIAIEREIYAVEDGLVTVLDVQAMAERLIRNAG